MRIGIDARMYGPKVGGAGIGRYVEQLILNLQKLDDDNEYVVFLKKENFKQCPQPNKRWEKVVADIHWYSVAEQTRLPRIIDKFKLDIVHFPHFNVPLRLKTPFVVTIHDLIMLDQPWSARASTRNRIFFALKRFGYKKTLAHATKNASKIVTISEHVKNQIIHRLGVSQDRVKVVYNGIDSAAISAQKQNKKSSFVGSRDFPIQTPFMLNVGNSYPHKNLETLLHAFSFFVHEFPDVSLVLVGPQNEFTDRLKQEAREIEIPLDRIFFLGFVSDEQLSELYQAAKFYIIPSKLEGFGIPPLEALQHGTPVAASRASSIPEILGPAAVYFDPSDIESMVEAMRTLLQNNSERTRVLTESHEILKRYKWSDNARALLDIYKTSA
ncbi:glycosyltransferase family 4 protein [Candidatus Uhrbacteria bacterium]|nr:glycosyltransferase family 4 protein [Candidatus Uhrbacteria bacterium]